MGKGQSIDGKQRAASDGRSVFWPSLFALAGIAILCGLGIWQLQRLQWKEAIIARMDSRMAAPASPIPPQSLWEGLARSDSEYRKIRVTGRFDHAKELYLFRAKGKGQLGPVFHVLTPLHLPGGGIVIINRGFVPEALRDRAKRAVGQVADTVKITGFLRKSEERNSFTPADKPAKGIWYSRDPKAMAAALELKLAAPFILEADSTANPGGWPRGGVTALKIPNNHLSYAWTWFGLAGTLLVVFGFFVWSRRHRDTQ